MPFRKSAARFAKTAEHVRHTTGPKHLFAYASAALCGVTVVLGVGYELRKDSTHPVTFAERTGDTTALGDRSVTLTARKSVPLSPAYRPLDPTPVIERLHHSLFGNQLALGSLGMGGTIVAIGLPFLQLGHARRRALAEGEVQHAMRTTSREDRQSYNDYNLEALGNMLNGPLPQRTPEELEAAAIAESEASYAHTARRFGLDPDQQVAHVVVAELKKELELPAWPEPTPLPSWPSIHV